MPNQAAIYWCGLPEQDDDCTVDDARRGAAGGAVGPGVGEARAGERGQLLDVHAAADVRRARQQHGLGGPGVAELCGADGAPAWHALLLHRRRPGESPFLDCRSGRTAYFL